MTVNRRPAHGADLTNQQSLVRLCRWYGLQPTKRLSQNFLLDRQVAKDTVAAAALESQDRVFEIGPGFGILTEELLACGAQVTAIEIDERLIAALLDRFGHRQNLALVHDDFFHFFRRQEQALKKHPYSIVANLPYNISSHFFETVLVSSAQPQHIVVLLQKEVAQRIAASAGTMSLLSLSVQCFGDPSIIRSVPRTSFWPVPEVDSALLKVKNIHEGDQRTPLVFRLARMTFASRRKQLHNSLSAGLHLTPTTVQAVLHEARLQPSMRPQELSLSQWRSLVTVLQKRKNLLPDQ